jgi:hypothetical protein
MNDHLHPRIPTERHMAGTNLMTTKVLKIECNLELVTDIPTPFNIVFN